MKKQAFETMIFVILSIDWELDFGKSNWNNGTEVPDYGGILIGTRAVEEMLDDLEIPCAWFIETHGELVERDTPSIFPSLVQKLSRRPLDELGTHIHWSRKNSDGRRSYPVHDGKWVLEQLEHSRRTLERLGVSPIMFRSGAFLGVRGLPRILQKTGYSIDSSVLWNTSNTLQQVKDSRHPAQSALVLMKKSFGKIPSPYFCGSDRVDCRGNSKVLEFPVHFSLTRLLSPLYFISHTLFFARIMKGESPVFLVMFFHIDEITDPLTGPNEKTIIDVKKTNKIRKLLERLQRMKNIKFVTFTEAREHILSLQPQVR